MPARPLTVASLLFAAAAAAQTPAVGVVIISDRPGAQAMSDTVAAQVQRALVREGVKDALEAPAVAAQVRATGAAEPRSCKGARSCAQNIAVLLGDKATVVTVDVGKLGGTAVVRLEALQAGNEKPLEVSEVSVEVDAVGEKTALPVTLFARKVAQRVLVAPPPDDAPLQAWVDPVSAPPAPPQVAAEPVKVAPAASASSSRSRAPAVVMTTVTALVAVAAVSFLASGLSAKGQYDGAREGGGTSLTRAQADGLASRANVSFTVALIAGSVAAGSGVVTGVLWAF
ncbi:MAG: hypothetical protein IPJ65_27960 [Archangiaceae bacterium]|nr:hypothetical protein [Archangiaceae bacterium]